jgi:hypothetical protein
MIPHIHTNKMVTKFLSLLMAASLMVFLVFILFKTLKIIEKKFSDKLFQEVFLYMDKAS